MNRLRLVVVGTLLATLAGCAGNAVRLGYAVWRAEVERDSRSDIELDVSGPSFGLDLSF